LDRKHDFLTSDVVVVPCFSFYRVFPVSSQGNPARHSSESVSVRNADRCSSLPFGRGPVSPGGKSFPSLTQGRIAILGKYLPPVPPAPGNTSVKRLISLMIASAHPWHFRCSTTGHELLSRISALPIQRVVLSDRLPVGIVPTVEYPDHSAHLETGDCTFRTGTWRQDPSRSPVRIDGKRSHFG